MEKFINTVNSSLKQYEKQRNSTKPEYGARVGACLNYKNTFVCKISTSSIVERKPYLNLI